MTFPFDPVLGDPVDLDGGGEPAPTPPPTPSANDLTGIWKNSDDHGTYYFRQVGNRFAWFGEGSGDSDPKHFANVALGTIDGDVLSINWCDVPKGVTNNAGDLDPNNPLKFKIKADPLSVKYISNTGSGLGNFEKGEFTPFRLMVE